ncbi:MAG: NHL repeat-containing protein [Ktedonobacteraceae bacterium]
MRKFWSPDKWLLYLALALSLVACGGNAKAGTTATTTPDTTNNQPGTGPKGLPLYCPMSVTVDRQDTIYVSDNDNTTIHERIIKLSPAGQELGEWHIFPPGNLGMAQGPGDAAFDMQGNMYVLDLDHDKVVKVSPGGKIIASWGSSGSGQGQFQEPQGIAVDSHGNIYVGDNDNSSWRIEEFSNTGKFLNVATTQGSTASISLAVDSSDNLYVASGISITEISPTGQTIGKLQITGSDSKSSAIWTALSINAHGDMYATQLTLANNSQEFYPNILKIDYATGKTLAAWSVWKAGIKGVLSMALDSQGNLYASELTNAGATQLQKFSSTGEVLDTWKGTCSS